MPVYRGPGGAGDATNDATVTAVQAAATSAATSATNAANSATAAANSATGAATSATNAANSATTAAGQATTAAGHATNASTFATNSSLSADDSADSATEAEGYASEAFDYKVEASVSAGAASDSADAAAASAALAEGAVDDALALYGDAAALDAAVTAAQLAETNAETAETNAETAATTATNAASTATTQATNAAASAVAADADATSASIDANEAQAAATAAQAAVSSATAIYGSIEDIQQAEANSEANRDAAAASAGAASNSASTATTQAGIATTQATAAATSAAQASAVALGNEPVRHSVRPSLLLDFANTKTLDPRITYTRASTGTFYDGKTVAKAEENLFLRSQEFENDTFWTKLNTTVTANSTTAPDGTTTADTLTDNATNGEHRAFQGAGNQSSALSLTFSAYVKQGTNQYCQLGIYDGSAYRLVTVDLTTGTITKTTGTLTSSISSAGNSWYRVSITLPQGTSNATCAIALSNSATPGAFASYIGSGSTIFVWGAQLEARSSVTAYTPTTTAPITNYIPALQTAASGVARFEHNPVTGESLGLEIEEQRTNLTNYSEQFDNTYWTKTGSTITSNTIVAPDGTLTGDKFIETSGSGSKYISTAVFAANTYTLSIYAKYSGKQFFWVSVDGSVTAVFFDVLNGTIAATGAGNTATITSVGNGWYRCAVTKTTASSLALFFGTSPVSNSYTTTGNGFDGVYIWGAQLEAGAFATSYIPTTVSQVTRSADSASMTGTNFSSWYRTDEGTVYAESFIPTNADDASGNYYFSICDGTTANSMHIVDVNGTVSQVVVGGTAQFNVTVGSEPTTFAKMSLAYKANDFIACVNATLSSADTSGTIPVVDRLLIGTRGDSNASFRNNGTIKKLAYYPKRLTNAELQGLTTV